MSARLTILSMLTGTALITLPMISKPDVRFIWNASASLPVGLYRIEHGGALLVGDIAVVMPPDDLADFLHQRRYLPKGLPLLKRVLALGGTEVCRVRSAITAYGMSYGRAREYDTQGRPLPVWKGCRTLNDGEAFFMNWERPDSFDGRYFGPLPVSAVIGRAIPIWTTEDTDPAVEIFREPVADAP